MLRKILHVLLLLLLLCDISTAGPFTPSRFVIIAPKLRPKDDTTGTRYLTQHGLWANLQKGFKSAGDRFGWSIAFGGILEFFSWPGASLGMQGGIEILADTRNDISFNPQGVNWEEGFIYSQQVGIVELSGGYLHRCVHNVDNLQTTNPEAKDIQRTLIYGSLTTRAVMRDTSTNDNFRFHTYVGADYYVITEDYRYPEQTNKISPDVEKLKLSLSVGNYVELLLGDNALYARYSVLGAIYSDTLGVSLRGELGINIPGEAINMQIFLGTEAFTDDGGGVIPRRSNFFFVGLRFFGKNIAL
jgi:hypothetical protein